MVLPTTLFGAAAEGIVNEAGADAAADPDQMVARIPRVGIGAVAGQIAVGVIAQGLANHVPIGVVAVSQGWRSQSILVYVFALPPASPRGSWNHC